jgi:dTDP-glucose pyrophosphorylase
MSKDIALVVPAAGKGSRFSLLGFKEPKPLIDLFGRPFFWWATESVRRQVPIRQLVFVVLREHIDDFDIERRIKSFYPEAIVIAIDEVTSGAAETAYIGISAIDSAGPVAVNDCDHAFMANELTTTVDALGEGIEGGLMCFRSSNPAYSYIRLDADERVVGTVEKQVVSPYAISGCYLFSDSSEFATLYEHYKTTCSYKELFISGIYNIMAERGDRLGLTELDRHVSFGTPDELSGVTTERFSSFLEWRS